MIFRLYRGHIYATLATLLAVAGTTAIIAYFANGNRADEVGPFLLFVGGMIVWIIALVLIALAYLHWVPKWEREERRTGRLLGSKEKNAYSNSQASDRARVDQTA